MAAHRASWWPLHAKLAGAGWQILRVSIAAAVAYGGVVTLAAAAESAAAIVRHNVHIPQQPLDAALKALAQQTGVQIVRFSDAVKGDAIVGPLDGAYSIDQALQELLEPHGLTYRLLNSRAYMVISAEVGTPKTTAAPGPTLLQKERAAESAEISGSLEEIIVTAQKVEERARDIPMSITVLTGRDLQTLGATQLADFANTVPSLNFTSSGVGQTQVNLRGITSGYNVSPTVGIYVDDVPYGSSTAFVAGAQLALDVGLFDMNRIEILRGPQGTLYGASTMGGLLKYVTNAPDTTAFRGTARTNMFNTEEGGVGYDASGAVNLPLTQDRAALRVGGFYRHNGGYIDNLTLNDEDVDQADMYGGRLDLLFAPSERLSVRLTAFAQDIDRDGSIAADFVRFTGVAVDGELEQRRLFGEPFEQRFRLVSSTLKYAFDFATLTSISSYQSTRSDAITDFSALYVPAFGGPSVFSAVGLIRNADTDKFTQELRLSASGRVVDWLVGAFFTDEDSAQFQQLVAYDPNGARSAVNLLTLNVPSRYEEYAGFGNLTFHLTDRLDLTGGVRYARNSQGQAQNGSGVLLDQVPERRSNDGVATYLANVRYRLTDYVRPYFRFATGYRPGGPNSVVNDLDGRPLAAATFDADRLTSYEVGLKVGSADRRLSADLAVYHIDWDDMQITAIRNGLGVIANAAEARSRGAELTVLAMPVPSLTVMGAFGYTDAELTQDAPDLGGVAGESLPDAPKVTAALSADYRFGVGGYDAFAGTTLRYIAERNANFDRSVGMPQYDLPDYSTVDVRTGVVLGGARVHIYCKNVGDERGQLSAITGTSLYGGPANVSVLQPRTFGVGVDVSF
ncbi:TonB-dependent receptor domain-containing protein [Steroidobacter sp.]|uniref:TonB-dependent receptor domain-containing protein n=1 Tax=Steroidobacter sp. TaxID=1978227 RepID=UPI001A48EDBF|nr:TonB-dependent receptor [Steroidobacter sp.]MBL8267691.1 TonB-dependent receptor [Steroidobacter sp.]